MRGKIYFVEMQINYIEKLVLFKELAFIANPFKKVDNAENLLF